MMSMQSIEPRLEPDRDPTEEMSLADGVLTTTIRRNPRMCYELFCDVSRVPEWLSVVKSLSIIRRTHHGRPREVAYLARLQGGAVGYTLTYEYNERARAVHWCTTSHGSIWIAGSARFDPIGDATLMTYDLTAHITASLPQWCDPFFEGHAASAVIHDFRDFVTRH